MKIRLSALLLSTLVGINSIGGIPTGDSIGSVVKTLEERQEWWDLLPENRRSHLTGLFDQGWFYNEIDEPTRIAYVGLAQDVYDFLESGIDSHPHDSYIGFAPMLLRASFHGAGTYTHRTGGSNGGTIFNHAELADVQNGCIETGTTELFDLFHSHDIVPLADTMVIAGVVALDAMEIRKSWRSKTLPFPRMDLLSITGGRATTQNIAHGDRLPSADDDPMVRFTEQYNLTLSETVALVGGAHNFGSAHGKCSGYQGQWTASPLSWYGPNGDDPTFFPDLLRDDWRWYEVCTYEDDMVNYVSIEDPFADAAIPEEGGEEDGEEEDGPDTACLIINNVEPVICEEQAMRGCDFVDGWYATSEFPCDVNLLQMRLKSDFFLKANKIMLPFAEQFAADHSLLAEEFGKAYHKITHNGLKRCGLSGHGCSEGHTCQTIGDDDDDDDADVLYSTCVHDSGLEETAKATSDKSDDEDNSNFFIVLLIAVGTFGSVTLIMVGILVFKVDKMAASASKAAIANNKYDSSDHTDDSLPPPVKKLQKTDTIKTVRAIGNTSSFRGTTTDKTGHA